MQVFLSATYRVDHRACRRFYFFFVFGGGSGGCDGWWILWSVEVFYFGGGFLVRGRFCYYLGGGVAAHRGLGRLQ